MATSSVPGFSLFPSAVPKIAIPNPHKRAPSLHRVSVMGSPSNSLSPNGESIMIKIEDQPPVPQFPSHLNDRRESTPSPEDIGRAITTASPIDGKTPTQPVQPASSSAAAAAYTPSNYQASTFSPKPSASLGTGSATTLVQNPPSASNGKFAKDPSPIVPIRSMFPTYDPSAPLQQQNYTPKRPIPAYLTGNPSIGAAVSRDDYRSSLSTPFITAGMRSAPPSVLNFATDAMSVNGTPRVSNQRDLEKLWEASHGTEPDSRIKTFELEMARIDEATFVFGAHPSLPFYTLQTYDTNEIAVSKTCPRGKANLSRDVVLCPIEPMARRLPPNDGLVAFMFPKLAAMLAINQSAALAKEHSLAPTDRDDIEAQAVRRAAKQEACNLRFNAKTGFYELEHPAIGRGSMAGDFAVQSPVPSSPTTIRSMTGKPVLHIAIETEGPLPCINVSDPNALRRTGGNIMTPPTSAGAGLRRLSTIPQTDASPSENIPPLASLDLTTETLHIDANAILELMPSLFSIDCIVSAIMAVAIADAKTNQTLGAMEIWKPRPAPPSRLGIPPPSANAHSFRLGGTRPGSVRSHAGSVFYATIAEREEAEEEAKRMRHNHERDVRGGRSSKSKSKGRTWFGLRKQALDSDDDIEQGEAEDMEKVTSKKSKRKSKKTKKVVMSEFDLEKLGRYQSGDRKGQELPAVTRSALSGLVMALRLFVWFLTMLVQFIAWLLVNVSRAVTSEKF